MTVAWDTRQYERFAAERDRPALDLLLRLPDGFSPHEIWDLGCGAGQHAALLKRRHSQAAAHGIDSSAEMLARARELSVDVEWVEGDIAAWTASRPADLIFANASLQWLTGHEGLFRRLAEQLAPGGVLAVQMPLAHGTTHHRLLREVASEGPWAERLASAQRLSPLLEPDAYYTILAETCERIDIWSTRYLQALEGEDAVLEWMKGTALRPMLTALADDPAMSAAFLASLGARLGAAFPRRTDGRTLMPFPRLFLVAVHR